MTEDNIIIEVRKNGETITLYHMPDGLYYLYVGEILRHPHLTAESAMRALATYIHDDS